MPSIPSLPDYHLDPPPDPPECPWCDAPLTTHQCVCGYEIDDEEINAERECNAVANRHPKA